jgi:hypothetical protein
MVQHRKTTYKKEQYNQTYQLIKDFAIIKEREATYKSSNISFTAVQKQLIYKLSQNGLFLGDLKDYYSKSRELLEYLESLANKVKGKSLIEAEKLNLGFEEDYNNYSRGNFVNLYHPQKNLDDPIKDFLTDPAVFTMAAKYLGEIPQLMMVQFLFTPENTLKPEGPMLWHLDRHHDSVFRMFINPYEMTKEHGATRAFPSKYHEYNYYQTYPYFTDEQAVKNGFDLNDIVYLTGKPGKFGVVDTCKNFHCGSISKKERFVTIMTFVPYLFKGDYNADNLIGDRNVFRKENAIIYEYFKTNSAVTEEIINA